MEYTSRSSHHRRRRSSYRRQSNDTFQLLSLPAELRLLVIEFSLPPVNDVSRHWPSPIPALLRTSKQFNTETKNAMKKWSPMHYIPDPTYLAVVPHPGAVMVEHICLSMFHDARLRVLRSGPSTSTFADDHRDLVDVWTENVSQLPLFETVHTITIDATPAPGWLRTDKPTWLPNLLNDKAVGSRFIYEHISPITDLVNNIIGFYTSLEHPIQVNLAGQYGQRSRTFPNSVQRRCAMLDLDITFSGQFIPEKPRRSHPMTIKSGISELYSPRSIPVERYRKNKPQIANAKRRLFDYTYSPTSEFLFQNCFEDNEHWTMHHLERLTDFVLAEDRRPRYIDVHCPDFAHRSFIVSFAKDLDLSTSSRGATREKEVRISRKSRSRLKTAAGRISFTDLLLTGAAAFVLFAIASYQDRVDRRTR